MYFDLHEKVVIPLFFQLNFVLLLFFSVVKWYRLETKRTSENKLTKLKLNKVRGVLDF